MEAKEVVKGLESSAIDVQVDKSLKESKEFANDLESNLMDLQVDQFSSIEEDLIKDEAMGHEGGSEAHAHKIDIEGDYDEDRGIS